MGLDKFYYKNGTPFYWLFEEVPVIGHHTLERKEPVWPEGHGHKVYMESMNEYEAAIKLCPSYDFWKNMLKTSSKVNRLIEEWRDEKMLMDQARAKKLLWEQAEKGNVSAQKILYEQKREEAEQKNRQRKAVKEEQKHQEIAENVLSRLKVVK